MDHFSGGLACGVSHNFSAERQSCLRSLETLPNKFVWCALLKTFIYKPVKNTISGGEKNNPVNSRFSISFFISFYFLPFFSYPAQESLESPNSSGIQSFPNAPHFFFFPI